MDTTTTDTTTMDTFKEIEQNVQKSWATNDEFTTICYKDKPKFFATFPYPYMNGKMHLGHAYTLSKVEFITRYKRQKGYNVLFPFGFHGTGMPIAACADKLKVELDMTPTLTSELIDSFEQKSQIKILWQMGIGISDLPRFTDPYYWIEYFPEQAIIDLRQFGLGADFNRSFVTTNINPWYDSFIKWQFKVLKQKDMVIFGKKYVIYSPKDGQPCADHDRSIGEGVGIKEYVCVKFQVVDADYILLVATSRLETFYGLTNLWINPIGVYQKINHSDGNTYVCTEHTLKNLKYQEYGEFKITGSIIGSDLVDKLVIIPQIFDTLSDRKQLKIISQPDIKMNKGSGIVGSVPAHSVFDYKNVMKYDPDIVFNGVVSVNGDPDHSKNLMAVNLTSGSKKKSKNKLDEADLNKEMFKSEHNDGTISVGKFTGDTCEIARQKIKDLLIQNNIGFIYCEAEDTVISRSNDECIVCLTDQWFVNYSNPEVTLMIREHLDKMELFDPQVKKQFIEKNDWIKEWPCSRSRGLGTELFDTGLLIDSLSDSTIYMAFYTISHKIKQIDATKFTFDVWEYIFKDGSVTRDIGIGNMTIGELDLLKEMKEEFNYWYPLDLRVSGIDLIGNHLTMCLYNHLAVWGKDMLPKSYAVNGHVTINKQKMSKSTGNFLTLEDTVAKYGADTTRFTLANAGSGIDNANFTFENADIASKKLCCEMDYCKKLIDTISETKICETVHEPNFWELVFDNNMNQCIKEAEDNMDSMNFQTYIIKAFYELVTSKNMYQTYCDNNIIVPNYRLLTKYLHVHLALINPICPHYSDYLWTRATNRNIMTDVEKLVWPEYTDISYKIIYLSYTIDIFLRQSRTKLMEKMTEIKGMDKTDKQNMVLHASIFTCYSDMQIQIIQAYKNIYNNVSKDPKVIVSQMVADGPKEHKNIYGRFGNFIKTRVMLFGEEWLNIFTDDANKSGWSEEYDIINKWGTIILGNSQDFGINKFVITCVKGSEVSMKADTGPGKPIISIEKN
jgi:leucyl-tRNA synthetase